jgi:hypothetical protein
MRNQRRRVVTAYFCTNCDEMKFGGEPHDHSIKIAPPPPEDLNLQSIYGGLYKEAKFKELEMEFQTKDSGERQEFSTGMVRDVSTNKARYDLVDEPMLTRWAELMGRGAVKYGENNWRKAATEQELNRFKESAFRHFMQWFKGQTDEDHGAAVFFNIAGAEMVKNKLVVEANAAMFESFKAGANDIPLQDTNMAGTVKISNIRMPDIRQG